MTPTRCFRIVQTLLLRLCCAFSAVTLGSTAVWADERWAFVLGIAEYEDPTIPDLANTVNDARTMAGSLNQMGFRVYYLENAAAAVVRDMVRRIAVEQTDSELGLFYYAGHGVQVAGANYALPADIRPTSSEDVRRDGLSVSAIVRDLSATGIGNLVVILDSCRDSPFPGEDAIGTGLALVDAPANTIIAYSTAPGEIALDGAGANSPYTAALASVLDGPQQDIRDVLRLVRAQVRLATGGAQTPWFVDNSSSEIIIQPYRAPVDVSSLPEVEDGRITLASTAWWTIANSADPRDFESFVDMFPDTDLTDAARRQLAVFGGDAAPGFPLMDLGLPEQNPEVPGGLSSIITECDVLATGIDGGLSLAEPVPHDLVNTRVALRACIQAVQDDPENPRLLGLLARVLFLERRFAESLYYSELAAERGNANAHGSIATIYRLGLDVPVDLDRAAEAVRAGAIAGSSQMRTLMGIFYREGWGVPQSFNEARRWMEIAALTGNVSAMTALGDMYRRGQLGPENHAMALVHYRKAAALGHTDAMNNIGMAYMRGQGVEQDPQHGVTWLSLASEQGNPYAAYQLGRAFLVGWGVEKNLAQAVAFFRLSAQRNFLDAYNYLGDALQSDEDASVQDLPQALASYIIAREAGLLRDTIESREETGRAIANIETLTARMSPEQRAEGERIAADWIEQYGLLDFELVNE